MGEFFSTVECGFAGRICENEKNTWGNLFFPNDFNTRFWVPHRVESCFLQFYCKKMKKNEFFRGQNGGNLNIIYGRRVL